MTSRFPTCLCPLDLEEDVLCTRDMSELCFYCRDRLTTATDDRHRKVTVLRGARFVDKDSEQRIQTSFDWAGIAGGLVPAAAIESQGTGARGTFTITVEFAPDAEEKR